MSPFLRNIALDLSGAPRHKFPFNVPSFSKGVNLRLTKPVTFIVGANGSGKSTFLETVAAKCGFNSQGGNRNHNMYEWEEATPLEEAMKLSWQPKITGGFFLRAETFFNFGSYIDGVNNEGLILHEGRQSVHEQSHGEFFLSLFQNRFENGLFILDEPEAALSPISQLAFLSMLHEHEKAGAGQFLIATHSPILICYPGATVYGVSDDGFAEMDYRETEHYRITKNFLDNPEQYLRHLFGDGDADRDGHSTEEGW